MNILHNYPEFLINYFGHQLPQNTLKIRVLPVSIPHTCNPMMKICADSPLIQPQEGL